MILLFYLLGCTFSKIIAFTKDADNLRLTLQCPHDDISYGSFLGYIDHPTPQQKKLRDLNETLEPENTRWGCFGLSYDGFWHESNINETGDPSTKIINASITNLILLHKFDWFHSKESTLRGQSGQILGALVGWSTGDLRTTVDWKRRQLRLQGSYFQYDEFIDWDEAARTLNTERSYEWLIIIVSVLSVTFGASGLMYYKIYNNRAKFKIRKMEKKDARHREQVNQFLNMRKISWYYVDNFGKEQGPFSWVQMRAWFEDGTLMPDTRVRLSKMYNFVSIHQIFPCLPMAFQESSHLKNYFNKEEWDIMMGNCPENFE